MTVSITAQFDCSQREFVNDIARIIYRKMGYVPPQDVNYLFRSQHPQEKMVLAIAEEIFEMIAGDSPSYDDEGEEGNDNQV